MAKFERQTEGEESVLVVQPGSLQGLQAGGSGIRRDESRRAHAKSLRTHVPRHRHHMLVPSTGPVLPCPRFKVLKASGGINDRQLRIVAMESTRCHVIGLLQSVIESATCHVLCTSTVSPILSSKSSFASVPEPCHPFPTLSRYAEAPQHSKPSPRNRVLGCLQVLRRALKK